MIFQPADNQQVHPIDISYRMELQTIAPSSLIVVTRWQTLFSRRGIVTYSISEGAYTASDKTPMQK